MDEIPKIFQPVVRQDAVRRNPEHWPQQVSGFLSCGYGGETTRKEEEHKRSPDGSEHAPPHYCYLLSKTWCERIDAFISDYFLLPKGSFHDAHLDRSAKDKSKDSK
jgi:hypothetical protein